jgi:glycosyltransferase involved in cell wall biosynthesis
VLLVHGGDVSAPGGLETLVRELAIHLAARGHEVEVFGRPDRCPPLAMTQRAEAARYDVVHHHSGAWPRRVPLGPHAIRTIHFCTAAKMAIYLRRGRLRTLLNPGNWRAVAEERTVGSRPWRLIAGSRRVRGEYARFYGIESARDVAVISNGASFTPALESRAALRQRYGIALETPVLLTLGRADFVKGYDLLARAWPGVRAACPEALWVRVGGGAVERREGRLLTGAVARQEALDWIHAADVGALPSYYEGSSLALHDMLAAGLFTLAHDVGNAGEIIRPGENGELVEPHVDAWVDALVRRLSQKPPHGTDGLPRSFAWEAIAEQTESLYREVAGLRATK